MPHRDWHRLQHRRMAARRMQRFHRHGGVPECDGETSHDELRPVGPEVATVERVARADDARASCSVPAALAILPAPSRARLVAVEQAWSGNAHVAP